MSPAKAILAAVTCEAVKAERARSGHGMMECKRRMTKAAVLSALGANPSHEDLVAIVEIMAEQLL